MLEVKNLCYTYNSGTDFQTLANDNISLRVPSGEILGIVGETGSGKSTFVKQLSGLLRPLSGEVLLNGKPLDSKKNKFAVGMVFQQPEHQLFADTVYDDIAFGPLNMRRTGATLDNLIYSSLEFVNLPKTILNNSPFELSGGEKKRVAIAGVIAMNPKVLILDEPTSNLDVGSRNALIGQLKNYHKEKNPTIIIVSHNMKDVLELCDRVALMYQGKLVTVCDTIDFFWDFDNLKNYGIEVPQIIKIMKALREKGYKVSKKVKNVDEAEREILKLLGGNI